MGGAGSSQETGTATAIGPVPAPLILAPNPLVVSSAIPVAALPAKLQTFLAIGRRPDSPMPAAGGHMRALPLDDALTLPAPVSTGLDLFIAAATAAFGETLRSVVLFGSAAEGRLRSTSDVNLVVVLTRFERAQVDAVRDALRLARAAIGLEVMFLLSGEIDSAAAAFAIKFADIGLRRRVLYGDDPFHGLAVPREALRQQVQQALLNLILRLRERYALVSLRQEQAVLTIAETAAPLRSCAATLLALEGVASDSPRQALDIVLRNLDAEDGGARWSGLLDPLRTARIERRLAPGLAEPVLFGLIELAGRMRQHAERLR